MTRQVEASRRLFFAIAIPNATRTALTELQQELRATGVQAGQWTRPALFHITLHFLGESPERQLPELEAAATRAASETKPFTLSFSQVGAFTRGGILWAGVADDHGLARLRKLYADLRTALSEVKGVSLESRPYSPHLTLARKLDVRSWTKAAGDTAVREALIQHQSAAQFPVEAVHLLESTRQDGQLVYPTVFQSPFRADEAAPSV